MNAITLSQVIFLSGPQYEIKRGSAHSVRNIYFFNLVGVIRRNISENIFRRWRIDEICAHISSTEYVRRNINIPSLHKVRSNITLQLCHLHHYILVIYKNSTWILGHSEAVWGMIGVPTHPSSIRKADFIASLHITFLHLVFRWLSDPCPYLQETGGVLYPWNGRR